MPYMTCNGKVVSRYSTTEEVAKCKELESAQSQQAHELCLASPECLADLEESKDMIYTCGLVFLITAIVTIFFICKFLDDDDD